MIRGLLRESRFYSGGEVASLSAFCPACDFEHSFSVDLVGHGHHGDRLWTFNGDYQRPTFHPSMFSNRDHWAYEHHPSCHSWLTDGHWHYLNDCSHALAGQVVPVPPPDPDMTFEKQHGWHLFPWCDSEGKPLFKHDGTPYNREPETNLPTGIFRSKTMAAITTEWVEHRGGFVRPLEELPAVFRRPGGKPAITVHLESGRIKVWTRAGADLPTPFIINSMDLLSGPIWDSKARGGERYWEAVLHESDVELLLKAAPNEESGHDLRDAALLREIHNRERLIDYPTMVQAFQANTRLRNMDVLGLDSHYKAVPMDLWQRILDGTDLDDCEHLTEDSDGNDFALSFKADCIKHFGLGNGVAMLADDTYGDHSRASVGLLVAEPDGTVLIAVVEPENGVWAVAPDGMEVAGTIII